VTTHHSFGERKKRRMFSCHHPPEREPTFLVSFSEVSHQVSIAAANRQRYSKPGMTYSFG
jgi:hypothetical protein